MELFHTIKDILWNTASDFGKEDAIRYKIGKKEIESKTYNQLKQDSESFSCALKTLGIVGEQVAIVGPSSYAWIVSYFGIVDSNSVAVPLDVSLSAEELCELINRAEVKLLVVDEARSDVISKAKEQCSDLKYIVSMQKEESEDFVLSFPQLLKENQETFDIDIDPDTLCTIMFTSGTTGIRKGVMLTHRNLAENATALDMKIPSRTVLLSVLPIHHAYCLSMDILKAISLGSIICINDSLLRIPKNIKLFQPDMILMVPLMIETFAKKLEDISGIPPKFIRKKVFGENLHTICSGGAYLNPEYIDLFEKYGITILQGYGMTECSPVISTNVAWNIKKDTVGQLMPNCEGKVVDDEILVRGSSVMQGYFKMPEETKEALEDGWLHTGDLGFIDDEGFIHLTGRKKNLIITKNGENVSPEEIENKLGESRLVSEILVREKDGVIEAEIFPDEEYAKKHRIKNIEKALQELIDTYNESAQSFKRVYHLVVREEEFEKTTSKKIIRF